MSLRSLSAVAVLAASAWCAVPAAWAQEATVQQVYQAAEAGKLIEAQALMDEVLRAHPNSGKAHFVEAELLARQGKFDGAAKELATAERLAPGLPFARPEAVQKLKTLLARTEPTKAASVAVVPAAPALPAAPVQAASNIPWTMILVIGGFIAVAFVLLRTVARRRADERRHAQGAGAAGMPAGGPGYPQYAGYPPSGPGGANGPGMGAGIMGGLATGAAVGAGAAAGGALLHHLLDGDGKRADSTSASQPAPGADPLATPDPLLSPEPPATYDMGGEDFGLSDPGGWDDGGGGGGGDEWT